MFKFAAWLALICLVIGAAAVVVRSFRRGTTVKEQVRVVKRAIDPKPQPTTEAADPMHKAECEAALTTANLDGSVVKNWRLYGSHGNVRVHIGYYHADLERKQALDKIVRCVLSEGREEDQGLMQVTYRDARSDELVAVWEKQSGFRMAE